MPTDSERAKQQWERSEWWRVPTFDVLTHVLIVAAVFCAPLLWWK